MKRLLRLIALLTSAAMAWSADPAEGTLRSVGAAVLLAVPLAVAAFPHPRWRAGLLAAAGLLQTVPSLALLAALIGLTGAAPSRH